MIEIIMYIVFEASMADKPKQTDPITDKEDTRHFLVLKSCI